MIYLASSAILIPSGVSSSEQGSLEMLDTSCGSVKL
jgi:hypothetical protein